MYFSKMYNFHCYVGELGRAAEKGSPIKIRNMTVRSQAAKWELSEQWKRIPKTSKQQDRIYSKFYSVFICCRKICKNERCRPESCEQVSLEQLFLETFILSMLFLVVKSCLLQFAHTLSCLQFGRTDHENVLLPLLSDQPGNLRGRGSRGTVATLCRHSLAQVFQFFEIMKATLTQPNTEVLQQTFLQKV